jgi:hypothetical protein
VKCLWLVITHKCRHSTSTHACRRPTASSTTAERFQVYCFAAHRPRARAALVKCEPNCAEIHVAVFFVGEQLQYIKLSRIRSWHEERPREQAEQTTIGQTECVNASVRCGMHTVACRTRQHGNNDSFLLLWRSGGNIECLILRCQKRIPNKHTILTPTCADARVKQARIIYLGVSVSHLKRVRWRLKLG